MRRPRYKNRVIIRLSSHPSLKSLRFNSKLVVVVVEIGFIETRLEETKIWLWWQWLQLLEHSVQACLYLIHLVHLWQTATTFLLQGPSNYSTCAESQKLACRVQNMMNTFSCSPSYSLWNPKFSKATIARWDLSATILFKLVDSHLIAFKFSQ